MTETFESALSARVEAMADACTRCGKCVEVCPVTGPGGVKAALASEASDQRGNSFAMRAHSASEDARERAGDTLPEPGSSARAEPAAVIAGIIDILKTGDGPEASRKWANACVLSGECIKACDYGVNPRFLLNMARVRMAQHANAPAEQRRGGVEGFRKVAREVAQISQLQLDDRLLARLGQTAGDGALSGAAA